LEESFILYKPKDIVAGDFYWMETVNDLVLFAACDCTGHGVPGALVSVVCHNALNRAVREFGLTQPAEILDKTAEIVIENFSKSEEDIKDGMDISLCSFNAKTKTIQWAGANNPLWLVRKGELIETKADKQPIGRNDNTRPFTNHQFNLNADDSIYLFTDGFADQFGGVTGEKKLTRKRFKEQLLFIQDKSMQEQGIILDKFIVEYRKNVEQIDDILVMGVKV
jgi:serine phosphatase RsbU (regulator of sigma subunit)